MNRRFIEAICAYLGINTKITSSWDYTLAGIARAAQVSESWPQKSVNEQHKNTSLTDTGYRSLCVECW